jgi:hypothetical protein
MVMMRIAIFNISKRENRRDAISLLKDYSFVPLPGKIMVADIDCRLLAQLMSQLGSCDNGITEHIMILSICKKCSSSIYGTDSKALPTLPEVYVC